MTSSGARSTWRRIGIGVTLVALVATVGLAISQSRSDGRHPTGRAQIDRADAATTTDDGDAKVKPADESRAEPSLWRRSRPTSRQVTLLGVRAVPDSDKIDAKLDKPNIAPLLRMLRPGYGFEFVGHASQRLHSGETLRCTLGEKTIARAKVLDVLDDDGNVDFQFELEVDGQTQLSVPIRTPPNQVFFCEKKLASGERLLIGVGAR